MGRGISEEIHRTEALEALLYNLHLNIPPAPFENDQENSVLVLMGQTYFALSDTNLVGNRRIGPNTIIYQFSNLFHAVGLEDGESEDLTLLIIPAWFMRDTANFLESLSLMDVTTVIKALTRLARFFGWDSPETKLDLALERLVWTIESSMEAIFPSLDTRHRALISLVRALGQAVSRRLELSEMLGLEYFDDNESA